MKNSRKRMPTQAEASLWARVMESVKPVNRPQNLAITEGRSVGQKTSKPQEVRSRDQTLVSPQGFIAASQRTVTRSALGPKGQINSAPVEVGKIGGTDRRTANKLKRGRMAIEARIDLHGFTEAQAYLHLLGFLQAARASGARCVLVVTGKGRKMDAQPGKLKTAVPRWLNEPEFRPFVLSVTYAQQKDGGDGALYILLRKGDKTRFTKQPSDRQ